MQTALLITAMTLIIIGYFGYELAFALALLPLIVCLLSRQGSAKQAGLRNEPDFFHLFRRLRHDLLNDIQLLSGHIQLNKPQVVLMQDVQLLTERITSLSRLFACGNERTALAIWSLQERAADMDQPFSWEVEGLGESVPLLFPEALHLLGKHLLERNDELPAESRELELHVPGNNGALATFRLPKLPADCNDDLASRLSADWQVTISASADEKLCEVSLTSKSAAQSKLRS